MNQSSGREMFQKYKPIIWFLVRITRMIPRRIRVMLFEHCRNRNGIIGIVKRYVFFSTLANSVGDNVVIYPGCYFEHIDKISVGNNVSIHQMCYIDAAGGVDIGDNVSIAHRSTILSSNHHYSDKDIPIKYQGMVRSKTIVSDNVWVGCGCTILAGVTINTGCVIGANSVLTKKTDTIDGIYVGSPARLIKKRYVSPQS